MSIALGEAITVLDRKFSPGWMYVRNVAGKCGAVPETCIKINELSKMRRPSVPSSASPSQQEINSAMAEARASSAGVIASASGGGAGVTDITIALEQARSASAEVIGSAAAPASSEVESAEKTASQNQILSVSSTIPPLPEFSLNASGEVVYPAETKPDEEAEPLEQSTGRIAQSGVSAEVNSISGALEAGVAPSVESAVPEELSSFLSRSPGCKEKKDICY